MHEKHSCIRVFWAVECFYGRQEDFECFPIFQMRALVVVALVVRYIGLVNYGSRMWIAELCMFESNHKRPRFGTSIYFM